MKYPVEKRQEIIKALLSGKIGIQQACRLLDCNRRSIERYRKAFLAFGAQGLKQS